MEINIARLNLVLAEYSSFAIYGCGEIAKETYNILTQIEKEPIFCVITDKNKNADTFLAGKIPVYCIKEKEEQIRNENILLILAVNNLNGEEIKILLRNLDIKTYLAITEFDRLDREYVERRDDLSAEGWLQEVAEWHIDSMRDYDLQIQIEIQTIKNYIEKGNNDRKKIVFVIGALTPRVIKIVRTLKALNYNIEMYASPQGLMQEICINELKKIQIECIRCKTIEELIYRLIISCGRIIHLFTYRGNSYFDKIIISLKEVLPPIVYDEYDIVGTFYTNVSQEMIDNEKYCLEHADAICNRGFEIEYLINEQDYHIKVPTIQFQDYCNDIQYENGIYNEEELSVCYVGQIISEEEYPEFIEGFKMLAEKCKENYCHFHVYPHSLDENKFASYIELMRKNEYFHVHNPIPVEQLIKEITAYDYGVFPVIREVLSYKEWVFNTHEKMVYCTTNKYFDYLDAGLPIIAAHSIKQVQFFKEKGILLDWTVEDYNFDELRCRKKELKEKVLIERKKLRISNYIHELIELYASL